MHADVVERYIRSLFPGVEEVNFFELRGNRNLSIVFINKESMMQALKNAESGSLIFVIEDDNNTLFADRDAFETIMYMMLVKESTDSWIAKFAEKVAEENEKNDQDDGTSGE